MNRLFTNRLADLAQLSRGLLGCVLLFAAAASAREVPVEVTSDEGLRLIMEGRLQVFDPSSRSALRAQRRDERRTVADYLRRHPESRADALRALKPQRSLAVTIGTERGAPQTVLLQSNKVMISELARSMRMAVDATNLWRIYSRLYAYAEPTGVLRDLGLPAPEAARTLPVEQIKDAIHAIVAARATIKLHIPLPPGSVEDYPYIGPYATPNDCGGGFQADAGNGYGGDQTKSDGQTCDVSWDGILANDARPYRNHLSCIRNQANRGTCAAFASASALEMGYSQMHDMKINLSEEMLYFRHKATQPTEKDGMNIDEAFERFVEHATSIPFELAWNYNPSLDRKFVGGGLFQWKYSCNAYNETCSNTTPQGVYTCFRPTEGGKKICGLTAPKSIGGVRLTIAPLPVWDPDDINTSIDTVKTLLDSGMQVTLGLMVNQAFKTADTNTGYISYDGSGQSNFGSHAVHVVSYIENEDLAKIVPGAPPGEAGPYAPKDDKGGYFIIRNSWGTCWGDGGYAYIPYRWLRPVFFVHSAEAHDPASLTDAP